MNSVYILMMFIWFIGWLYAVGVSLQSPKQWLADILFDILLVIWWPIYLGYKKDR